MPRVSLSNEAKQDLDEIGQYIAQDSLEAAIKWLGQIDNFFARIALAPGIGTSREKWGSGLRSAPIGNYLVFFRARKAEMYIVRVIHGARNWQRILKQPRD